jgi:hypothetical protein
LFQELDHKGGIVLGLNTLGELARLDGDYTRAGRLDWECLTISNELGNRRQEAVSLANLSYVAYHECNYIQAINFGKKALSLLSSLQADHAIAIVLAIIAGPSVPVVNTGWRRVCWQLLKHICKLWEPALNHRVSLKLTNINCYQGTAWQG